MGLDFVLKSLCIAFSKLAAKVSVLCVPNHCNVTFATSFQIKHTFSLFPLFVFSLAGFVSQQSTIHNLSICPSVSKYGTI